LVLACDKPPVIDFVLTIIIADDLFPLSITCESTSLGVSLCPLPDCLLGILLPQEIDLILFNRKAIRLPSAFGSNSHIRLIAIEPTCAH